MSGGSFNYLCHRNSSDIFSGGGLEEMAAELEDLGYLATAPADRTRKLLEMQAELDAEIAALAPIWHAVEWWRSGDWSRDQAIAELGAWRERHKHA